MLLSLSVFAQQSAMPVPRDPVNEPVYKGLSKPYFSEAVELTTDSYVILYTLPATSENYRRHWTGIAVRNPSGTRSVYVCLGTATACTTDAMKIPPSLGFALDGIYYGPLNSITTVWGKLDAAGSVTPEVTVW